MSKWIPSQTGGILPHSENILWGLSFVFFMIWAKSRKFIHEISVVYCSIVIGFTCDHGPVEVFSAQSRWSLSDPKRLPSSTLWDHRRSTVPTERYPLTLHPIPTPRIGLCAARTWSSPPNRQIRLLGMRWSQVISEWYQSALAVGCWSQGKCSQEVEV